MRSLRVLIVLTLVTPLAVSHAAGSGDADATGPEVERAFDEFIAAWEREDPAGAVGVFTADGIAYDPTPPGKFEGAAALRTWADGTFAELSNISIRITDRRVQTAGATGWVTGRYRFTAQHAGSSALAEGHLSVVFVKQPDGSFRVPLFHASRLAATPAEVAADTPPAPDPLELSGLRLIPPPGWAARKTTSRMRAAEFVLAAPATDSSDATLIVYYFGPGSAGSVLANIERWCGQLAQPDGRDSMDAAATGVREINGMTVHTVDVSGTYVAETRPGSGERVNEPDSRLLAAIIETEAGPYYLKLVGPAGTVEHWRSSFERLLATAQPAAVRTGTPAGHP